MAIEYSHAPEIEKIAVRLIDNFHPHLHGAHIVYLFLSDNPKNNGREVLGRARKVTGLSAFLAGNPDGFFVLEIARPSYLRLSANQQIALVDHELCHFGLSESGELTIVNHDIEEFNDVAMRHGAWLEDAERFYLALQRGEGTARSRQEMIDRILGK